MHIHNPAILSNGLHLQLGVFQKLHGMLYSFPVHMFCESLSRFLFKQGGQISRTDIL